MAKVDYKKTIASYSARKGKFAVVKVPPMQYLMIDGHDDPNTSDEFRTAVESLFPLAYKLKFFSKLELGVDYVVMPLEGLWWADDMTAFTSRRNKADWHWTLMIMTPDHIGGDAFEALRKQVVAKDASVRVDDVRLETYDEGLCAQTLHVGSYDDEGPVLQEMHETFIPENGLALAKKHHEIYLSDTRKTEPAKLKTILRQPVTR